MNAVETSCRVRSLREYDIIAVDRVYCNNEPIELLYNDWAKVFSYTRLKPLTDSYQSIFTQRLYLFTAAISAGGKNNKWLYIIVHPQNGITFYRNYILYSSSEWVKKFEKNYINSSGTNDIIGIKTETAYGFRL